jgi:hypothetical protein
MRPRIGPRARKHDCGGAATLVGVAWSRASARRGPSERSGWKTVSGQRRCISAMRGRREPAPMTKPGRTSGAGLRTMIY